MDLTLAVEEMEYRRLTEEIKRTMKRSARDAVQLGFMLRHVLEGRIFAARYDCFEDYLQEELQMEYSLASRFIAINKKYSISGKSMDISPEYAEYSQGVLIEMLNMPPELEKKVTPEMTVREVREIKRQAKRKKEKPVPEQEKAEAVIDGEYREIPREPKEEVATSQQETAKEPHDEYGFVRQYMKVHPSEAKGCIEICRMERDSGKYAKALQGYISPYGCHSSGCKEWSFDFHSFAKGLDMRIGTEKIHFTYNRFATVLMKVAQEEGKLSAYGLPKTVYPEGSLLTAEGCGNKYDCFSCAKDDCDIRQKDRYCREASLGDPYSCMTMGMMEQLKKEMGDACQFIDQGKAYHTRGTNEPDPCCKECQEICEHRCRRSLERADEAENSADKGVFRINEVKRILAEESRLLGDYNEAGGLPETTLFRQETIVKALEFMVSNLEAEETGQKDIVQPELPVLKNTDQRKKWLRDYKIWGLWYRDENIDVNYYKYDFPDGSRLIVEEHLQRQDYWRKDAKDEYFFHLLEKGKTGCGGMQYDEKYRRIPDSETYLIAFLKNIQKI